MWTGMLSIDEDGVRIEGPVPYRADFREIRSLDCTQRPGLFFIALQSTPPVFITPVLFRILGLVDVSDPTLWYAVYTALHRRLGGPGRCARCGCDRPTSDQPCPECGGSAVVPRVSGESHARRWKAPALVVGLVLAGVYVGSYIDLSRRGMAEARAAGFPYFFYVPLREIGPGSPGLSRHYDLRVLYGPINRLDRAWFGSGEPCDRIT